jgi:hypothetical protein
MREAPIIQDPPDFEQRRHGRSIELASLGGAVLSVFISELPKEHSTVTDVDVARLLVEREIRRREEKLPNPISKKAAIELQQQREEMLRGYPEAAPTETIKRFGAMALLLSEERLVYSVRTNQQRSFKRDAARRNRDLDALRRLKIALQDDLQPRPIATFWSTEGPPDGPDGWLLHPHVLAETARSEALRALQNLRPAPAPDMSVAWHGCAVRIAAAYSILFDGLARRSKDGDLVRFVELALAEIGARPLEKTEKRSSIEKAIRRGFSDGRRREF